MKSKGVYNSKLKPLYTAFLHSKNLSEYRIEIKFEKDPLAVEENNYTSKVANGYIVCDLDAWPKIPLRNFTINNCLFGAASITKNISKEKYMYGGYGTAFNGKDEWSFDNDTARNVVFFGVDNSSSSHADNLKNNFLVLGEGDIFGINGSFGAPEKKVSINFSKANKKFCWSLYYNADNSYLFVNGKEISNLRPTTKMLISSSILSWKYF